MPGKTLTPEAKSSGMTLQAYGNENSTKLQTLDARMAEITVRPLNEGDARDFQDLRLRAAERTP